MLCSKVKFLTVNMEEEKSSNKTFNYFGYGSNLLKKRIHLANPPAVKHGIGKLDNENKPMRIPPIGLGTWKSEEPVIENAVKDAIKMGYRHIDTAFNYNNEEQIGRALQKLFKRGVVKREDLFITTKLPVFGNRAKDVERFLDLSLKRLQLEYVDLFLIHMPFALKLDEENLTAAKLEDGSVSIDFENNNLETWKVLEQQVRKNLTKFIGLSNFNQDQVMQIYNAATIKPSALQVELHAYLQQPKLVKCCHDHDITVIAYAPLGSPTAHVHFEQKYQYFNSKRFDLFGDPVVRDVSARMNKKPAQVLLRYLLQKGICIIPKSSNAERLQENISLFDFELSAEDEKLLGGLDKGEKYRIFDFQFLKGIDNHPNYPFL